MSRSLVVLPLVAATLIADGCRRGAESDPVAASVSGSYVYAVKGVGAPKIVFVKERRG